MTHPVNSEITIHATYGNNIQSVELFTPTRKSIIKQTGMDKTELRLHTVSLQKGVCILTVKAINQMKNQRIIIL